VVVIPPDFTEDYRDIPVIQFGFSMISSTTISISSSFFFRGRNTNSLSGDYTSSMNESRAFRVSDDGRVSSVRTVPVRNPVRKESSIEPQL